MFLIQGTKVTMRCFPITFGLPLLKQLGSPVHITILVEAEELKQKAKYLRYARQPISDILVYAY